MADLGNKVISSNYQKLLQISESKAVADGSGSVSALSLDIANSYVGVGTTSPSSTLNVVGTTTIAGTTHLSGSEYSSSQLVSISSSGGIIPVEDDKYDLGSPTHKWRHLYLATGSLFMGTSSIAASNLEDIVKGTLSSNRDGAVKPGFIDAAQIRALTGGTILDSDTFIRFSTADEIKMQAGGEVLLTLIEGEALTGRDVVIVGDGGDVDFQVKTTGNTNTIYAEGSSGKVGIGTNTPQTELTVSGSISASGNMVLENHKSFLQRDTSGNLQQIFRLNLSNVLGIGDTDIETSLAGDGAILTLSESRFGFGTTEPAKTVTVAGDISASGTIFADRLEVTEITSSMITSSTIVTSGSNIFGDEASDTHTFNGNITASGHISGSGTIIAEHFLSSDDAVITDNLTVGGQISASSDIKGLTLTATNDITANGNIVGDNATNISGINHITASGNISASGTSTGSFGNINTSTVHTSGNLTLRTNTNDIYFDSGSRRAVTFALDNKNNFKIEAPTSAEIDAEQIIYLDSGAGRIQLGENDDWNVVFWMNDMGTEINQCTQSISNHKFLLRTGLREMNIESARDLTLRNNGLSSQTPQTSIYLTGSKVGIGNFSAAYPPRKELTVSGSISGSGDFSINEITASGNVKVAGNILANGNIIGDDSTDITNIETIECDNIVADGDTNTKMSFSAADTIEFTAGSHANFRIKTNEVRIGTPITASGNISASGTITAEHFVSSDDAEITDDLIVGGDITASGNISSSGGYLWVQDVVAPGTVTANTIQHRGDTNTNIKFTTDKIEINAGGSNQLFFEKNHLTASGNISASGTITADHFVSADDIEMGHSIIHKGDADTNIAFGSDSITLTAGNVDMITLTENGTNTAIELGAAISTHITASGNISSSGNISAFTGTGSFGAVHTTGNISSSGAISASGNIITTGEMRAEHLFSTDDAEITDDLTVGGDLLVADNIVHKNDSHTKMSFATDEITFTAGGETMLTLDEGEATQDEVVVGNATDIDFRVRTDTDNYSLFVEGSSDRVGIGENQPKSKLHVDGDITATHITASGNISASGTIIADNFTSTGGDTSGITISDDLKITGDITASGNISMSGDLFVDSSINSDGAILPITSNGAALGSTSKQWSDLFLAEGGVINFDNGDVAVTQTGPKVAVSGSGDTVLQVEGDISASGGLTLGKTSTASDVASSAGNITINQHSISHTLVLNANLADDAEHADVTVTTDKCLATSVVIGCASAKVQVFTHTIAAGSFKFFFVNKSGGQINDDATIVFNFTII